jgi:glucokinase
MAGVRLVADIGGTNLRAALAADDGALLRQRTLACADHPDLEAALRGFIAGSGTTPRSACLAVAGPVDGDAFAFTNSPWRFSRRGLRAALVLERLEVINDFAALALSLPLLGAPDLVRLGGGDARPGQAMLVIGPGTGLGVAALVPAGAGNMVLPGEGGHAGFAPQDTLEAELAARLYRDGGRVSNETILCGRGLERLYVALADVEGIAATPLAAAEVNRRGQDGSDPLAARVLDVFCAVLGAVAGDCALVCGARGGVFIGGGIAPRLMPFLATSRFRARFEDKAPQGAYMASIPTSLITAPAPALRGALAFLDAAPGE